MLTLHYTSDNIKLLVNRIYSEKFDEQLFAEKKLPANLIMSPTGDRRPNSVSFEGAGFGDEGKGLTAARAAISEYERFGGVIVYRWNGGSNAGHESILSNGKTIALHQFSMGALYEGAHSVCGRSMVFNPWDATAELEEIKVALGSIPGTILIDPYISLSLDTHRAIEQLVNFWYIGYSGSTGRGISPTYSDDIMRVKLTMNDLMAPDWRARFGYHYICAEKYTGAFGVSLKEMRVSTLKNATKGLVVGTKKDFLDRLGQSREIFKKYVAFDLYDFLLQNWQGEVPFVFEGAQAIGLHMKHGAYPDITTSETRARGIQDSTEGIVDYKKIAGRFGVLKGPYMSSVGSRVMPGEFDLPITVGIREEFGEYGATTGRPRGIIPPDFPALRYWRNVSDYEYLVVTHMDTTLATIPVVIGYKDKKGNAVPYRPYQSYLDFVYPEIVELPGWDGGEAKKAKVPAELPKNALKFLALLSGSMDVPVAWIGTGPRMGDIVSWL